MRISQQEHSPHLREHPKAKLSPWLQQELPFLAFLSPEKGGAVPRGSRECSCVGTQKPKISGISGTDPQENSALVLRPWRGVQI